MTKNKLKKVLLGIDKYNSRLDGAFKNVEKEINSLMSQFRDNLQSEVKQRSDDTVSRRIAEVKVKTGESLGKILGEFDALKRELSENEAKLSFALNKGLQVLTEGVADVKEVNENQLRDLAKQVGDLKNDKVSVLELSRQINESEIKLKTIIGDIQNILEGVLLDKREKPDKDLQQKINELDKELKDFKSKTYSNMSNRGGSAHLQINVNSSVASTRYADINFQQFGNIGWSVSNDDVYKRVNIRASILAGGGGSGTPGGNTTEIQYNASGSFAGDPALAWASSVLAVGQPGSVAGRIDLAGATSQTVRVQAPSTAGAWVLTLPANDGAAGQYLLTDGNGVTQWASVTASGGSGITRTVSVLSVSSTLAAAASTDYTFFINDGVRLTLPDAVNNTNRYSIKNVSTSSVQVSAATGQDIDGATTALLTKQYEAIDLMSNSSVWGIY